jgi:hypothetical protein
MAEEALLETPDIEEDVEDGSMSADIDVPTMDEEEEEPEKESEVKEEPEKEPDDEMKSRFDKLEENYKLASKHIDDLNRSMSGLRKENKKLRETTKQEDKDASFTDAQLIQIMEENKDDPGVMLHAMKELVKQSNADLKDVTEKNIEISRKKSEVDGFMAPWKEYVEKNSEGVDKVVDYLGIQDHFAKEHLAVGSMILNNWQKLVEQFKEEGRKEALSGISEETRKGQIKNNKPDTNTDDIPGTDGGAPSNWRETAKLLGMNKKQQEKYYSWMKNKTSTKKGE